MRRSAPSSPILFLLIPLVATGLLIQGCGGGKSTKKSEPPPPQRDSLKEQLQKSLDGFADLDPASIRQYNSKTRGLFGSVFGGVTGSDVRTFVDERISLYLTENEFKDSRTSPATFLNQGMFASFNSTGSGSPIRRKAQLGASNVGTFLWYLGLINDEDVSFTSGDQTLAITSPRVGLMKIGPGFDEQVHLSSGESYRWPRAYGQGLLVHEARHSDCTGGISKAQIEQLKHMNNYDETLLTFPDLACGHIHAKCTRGDFAGLSACDRHPFGSYSTQLIFIQSLMDSFHGVDLELMRYLQADLKSRLEAYSFEDLLSGRLGEPDMSSAGVRE